MNNEEEYVTAEEEQAGNELVISDQGGYRLHKYMRLVYFIISHNIVYFHLSSVWPYLSKGERVWVDCLHLTLF